MEATPRFFFCLCLLPLFLSLFAPTSTTPCSRVVALVARTPISPAYGIARITMGSAPIAVMT